MPCRASRPGGTSGGLHGRRLSSAALPGGLEPASPPVEVLQLKRRSCAVSSTHRQWLLVAAGRYDLEPGSGSTDIDLCKTFRELAGTFLNRALRRFKMLWWRRICHPRLVEHIISDYALSPVPGTSEQRFRSTSGPQNPRG